MTDETESPPPEDTRTFRERLRDVGQDVAYMEKGGFNAHFKYAFLQEAEVKRSVGAALRRHGLIITRCEYRALGVPTGQSAVLSCTLSVRAIAANDNGETAEFTGIGGGADSSDKAPMKACAAALKYAITSGFLIATGDDPEEDGGTKAAPKTRAKKSAEPDAPDDRQQQLPHVPDEPTTTPQQRADTALAAIAAAADRKALAKLSLPLAALSRAIPKDVYEAVRLAYVARSAALKEAS